MRSGDDMQQPVFTPARREETDVFAIVTFASGILGLLILPIVFAPLTLVFGMISYYRLKENPRLRGKGLRFVGAICGAIALLVMFRQLGIL